MTITRILLVDDDKSILRMLEYGISKLGPEIQVHTAENMSSALNQIEKQWFDLVITDYMMPGMTGIDLARAIHSISPETQIVLMTAYGTTKLRETTAHIGVDGYLDKPFDIEEVRKIIRQTAKNSQKLRAKSPVAITGSLPAKAEKPENPVAPSPPTIAGLLQKLQSNASASAVILIDSAGTPVKTAGQIDYQQASKVAALVASSFMKTSELSRLLNNRKGFKSGFYEGDAYNIYTYDVNNTSLLAVIFDVKLRPGVIWFYAKQTAAALLPLLQQED